VGKLYCAVLKSPFFVNDIFSQQLTDSKKNCDYKALPTNALYRIIRALPLKQLTDRKKGDHIIRLKAKAKTKAKA
jgi:hypothetical protein